jgi:putative ABC transport system permease protein
MHPIDRIRSLGAAFAHRVRAVLTLVGVVIGTGSIVLLASLLRGGEEYLVHTNQEASGDDVVEAHRGERPPEQRDRTSPGLSRADADAVRRTPALEGALVAAESAFDTYARYDGRKKRVAVVSSSESTMSLYRLTIEHGRSLDAEDRRLGARACVIGHEVYEDLARSPRLEGLRLEIDGHLFSVVGVLAKKPMIGSTDSTYLWDRKVMIPETTYDALHAESHQVDQVYVRRATQPVARATLSGVLARRHYGVQDFELAKDESGGMEALILAVIRVLMLGTGVLALLASGINIMNVMLVTVAERTREIGLRRALGATARSVLIQFLLESATLSLAGALVGIASGIVVAWSCAWALVAALGHWEFSIQPWSIALGLTLALTTGIVFGALPAWRAARVSPIDALRSE